MPDFLGNIRKLSINPAAVLRVTFSSSRSPGFDAARGALHFRLRGPGFAAGVPLAWRNLWVVGLGSI